MLPSYEKIAENVELDHDGAPFDSPDLADIADANAFEELAQNQSILATTAPDQSAINESMDVPDVGDEMPDDTEAGNTEAIATVFIDHFPSASAGAAIHDMPRGDSIHDSWRGADGDSIWSPFLSQCDWLFAHWAKMRGPTASAVTELLAIPEVRTSRHSIFMY